MVKRASTESRWTVFSLVMDYIPNRSLSRFAIVSKAVHHLVESKDIQAPSYAPLIEDFARAAHHPDITFIQTKTSYQGSPVYLECDYDKDEKMRLRIFHEYYGFQCIVLKCNAYRLKQMLYRLIERNKMIRDRRCNLFTVGEFFEGLDMEQHAHFFIALIE